MRKYYGALYVGKNVANKARLQRLHLYNFVFLARRMLFICLTVFLFEYPALQMVAHWSLTLLTINFLAFDLGAFDSVG